MYSFLRPESINDFLFYKGFKNNGSTLIDSYFNLDPLLPFKVGCVKNPIPAVDAAVGTLPSGQLTFRHDVEYLTTSQWAETGMAPQGPNFTNALAYALEMSITYPDIHDNPKHFSDFVNFVRDTIGVVSKATSSIPGPIGTFSQAVSALNSAIPKF